MKQFTVLITAPWYPAGPIRFIAEAIERIGCRVIRIGAQYNDHMKLNWGTDVIIPDRELPREAPRWDLNEFVDWTTRNYQAPDMLLVSEENYQTDIVPTKKIPSVLWSFDGWPNSFNRYDLYQPTVAYINHPFGIRIHPRMEEDPRWKPLFGAYAPWLHIDYKISRTTNFVLYATMYGKRLELCHRLNDAGLSVLFGTVTTKEYVRGYNASLCTLHNPQPSEIKWRWWEAIAMGCVNISWHTTLFDRLGYKEWEHYIPIYAPEGQCNDPWPTTNDLINKVDFLKNNLPICRDIANAAQKLAVRQDTYFHRAITILRDLGMVDIVNQAESRLEARFGFRDLTG